MNNCLHDSHAFSKFSLRTAVRASQYKRIRSRIESTHSESRNVSLQYSLPRVENGEPTHSIESRRDVESVDGIPSLSLGLLEGDTPTPNRCRGSERDLNHSVVVTGEIDNSCHVDPLQCLCPITPRCLMKTVPNHDRLTICLVCGLAMILIVILSLLSNDVKREPPTATLEQIPQEELIRYKTLRRYFQSPKRNDIIEDPVEKNNYDVTSLMFQRYRLEIENRYPILKNTSDEELGSCRITYP